MTRLMTIEQSTPADEPNGRWLALGVGATLIALCLRVAWVSDDAFITLRTVDNWLSGYGLRWNVDERVQTYTHPLWMFALSGLYLFTREPFVTAIVLGIFTTGCALFVLTKLARSDGHAVTALALLALSRSFIDYATSGLENPLCHLLLGVFVWLYMSDRARLQNLALTTALLALTRLDACLMVLPALMHAAAREVVRSGARRTLRELAMGFTPLVCWELFSLFYYGFLFPNTAYAKLNTGLPAHELMQQGLVYMLSLMVRDLPTAAAIGLGAALALQSRRAHERALALGLLVYLAYVVRVGGDFMLGRFFTLPLFGAACLIARSSLPLQRQQTVALLIAPFLVLLLHPAAQDHAAHDPAAPGVVDTTGVVDERSYYLETSSLRVLSRNHSQPSHDWATEGRMDRASNVTLVLARSIGIRGFFGGPKVHYIDEYALTDVLLARLPLRNDPQWRVGHYVRTVPPGYPATIARDFCSMEDPALCAYHARLREIVAADLWSWQRLSTIVAMNLGRYQHLIDVARYRYPAQEQESIGALSEPIAENEAWDHPRARKLGNDGVQIALNTVSHARSVELMLDGNDSYSIEWLQGPRVLARTTSSSLDIPRLHTRQLSTPAKALADGFDSLLVRPLSGDDKYSIGHLRLH